MKKSDLALKFPRKEDNPPTEGDKLWKHLIGRKQKKYKKERHERIMAKAKENFPFISKYIKK